MAYSPAVVQRARARLAQAKAAHEAETAARLEAAYEKFPELVQIDRQLRTTMAQVVATSFRKGEDPAQAIAAIWNCSVAGSGSWRTMTNPCWRIRRSAPSAAAPAMSARRCASACRSSAARSRKRS